MLLSVAYILIFAILGAWFFQILKLPKMIGMLLVGVLIGPYVLNAIDASILKEAADIRKLALIVILIRAGFAIRLADFKSIGRAAILMSFVPACAELLAYTLLAPLFFGISYGEAALMGSVMAAVSPAVVVPRMVDLIEQKKGSERKVPQLILAGASFDDVVVLVLFSAFLGLVQSGHFQLTSLLQIPVTIISSSIVGLGAGVLFVRLLTYSSRSVYVPDIYQYLCLFSLCLLLMAVEMQFADRFPFSGLLAILMAMVQMNRQVEAEKIVGFSSFFSRLWFIGEIFLFVLVGASVDISYVVVAGLPALGLIGLTLLIRSMAVWFCISANGFTHKEKLFCVIAYLPKATVQAAIGGIPLAAGLASGQLILSVAVLGILLTAPLGAVLLDKYSKDLLS